jgi:hypothetical protein
LLLNILFQVFALFLSMKLERHHVQFFTAVCNDWLLLRESDEAKDIVVKALPPLWRKRPHTFVIVGLPPLLVLRVSKGAWVTNKRDELK